MTSSKTIVVFRRWKTPNGQGEILALFPEIDAGGGLCSSYEHVGQHGAASYSACIVLTVPALPTQYKALRHELERLGYKLVVHRRRPAKRRPL